MIPFRHCIREPHGSAVKFEILAATTNEFQVRYPDYDYKMCIRDRFEIVQADFCILNIAAVCYIDSLVVSVFLEKLHFLYILINIYGLPLLQMFQYCGAVQIFISHPKASDLSIYPAEPERMIRRRPSYSAQWSNLPFISSISELIRSILA